MVLEHLFSENWLENKARHAFLLAVIYSSISILAARLLFAANSGLVSVMFVSLLLLPYMRKLLLNEERREFKETSFSLMRFWQDNKTAIKVYIALFFGIYLTYTFFAFILPTYGHDISVLFREQLALEMNLRGNAASTTLINIFLNNWWVLLACFLVALIAGDGALFFIAWNASSWGTIFGFRALQAAGGAFDSWTNLAIILLITLPHVVLEGGAYMLAAISGTVLSDDVLSKPKATIRFILAFVSLTALFVLMVILLQRLDHIAASIIQIILVLVFLYSISLVFDDVKHKRVFRYTYMLFIAAILIFLIGVFVETLVLEHSTLLKTVYMAAFR